MRGMRGGVRVGGCEGEREGIMEGGGIEEVKWGWERNEWVGERDRQ